MMATPAEAALARYDEHLGLHPDQAHMVTHPQDPRCPGHDINRILIRSSLDSGFCLCIHPFMSMINFSGMSCTWCGQAVTEDSAGPAAKDLRTQAVRDELGDGRGKCPDLEEANR